MNNKEQTVQPTSVSGNGTKPIVISSCDCFIGFLSSEKVNKSTIDFEVNSIYNMMPKYKEYNMLKGEPLTPKEIVDNRRGYLSRFIFCPYCGQNINWKQVLSNCL